MAEMCPGWRPVYGSVFCARERVLAQLLEHARWITDQVGLGARRWGADRENQTSRKALFTSSSAVLACTLSASSTQLRHHQPSRGRAASSASIAKVRARIGTGRGSHSVTPGTSSFHGNCSPDGRFAAITAAAEITSSGRVSNDSGRALSRTDSSVFTTDSSRSSAESAPSPSRKSSAVSLSKGSTPHVPTAYSNLEPAEQDYLGGYQPHFDWQPLLALRWSLPGRAGRSLLASRDLIRLAQGRAAPTRVTPLKERDTARRLCTPVVEASNPGSVFCCQGFKIREDIRQLVRLFLDLFGSGV